VFGGKTFDGMCSLISISSVLGHKSNSTQSTATKINSLSSNSKAEYSCHHV